MRNHVSHLAVAILTAVIGVACSGTKGVGNDRRVQGGGDRGTNENMSLTGCVYEAPGTNAFVLRDVVEVAPEQQPQGQERMSREPIVPRGSFVRLAGDEDLKNYVGKHVTVTGQVRDPGTNTIGTAGQSSELPRAGVSNSQPPLISVEHVKETEGMCGTLPGDTARPSGGPGRGR
jgi:hypothetical protein